MHPINLLTAVLLPNPHEVLGQLELSELVTTSGHDGSTSCCDS